MIFCLVLGFLYTVWQFYLKQLTYITEYNTVPFNDHAQWFKAELVILTPRSKIVYIFIYFK